MVIELHMDDSELSNLDTYSDDQLKTYFNFNPELIGAIRVHANEMRHLGEIEDEND
jgi:hypothetical protein